MSVEWCPTGEITRDLLTKQIKGIFWKYLETPPWELCPKQTKLMGNKGSRKKKVTYNKVKQSTL